VYGRAPLLRRYRPGCTLAHVGTPGHARAQLRAVRPSSDLTVDEAAARLHCSRRQMFRLLSANVIPSVKIGRHRMINSRHVDQYLAALRSGAHT
jgi:excisionase family DNA binding protein